MYTYMYTHMCVYVCPQKGFYNMESVIPLKGEVKHANHGQQIFPAGGNIHSFDPLQTFE